MTGKTLKELNVQVGDVVECVSAHGDWLKKGKTYTVDHDMRVVGYDITSLNVSTFRIITRAPPTLWRDLTPAEKGALLLAHHEGKTVQGTRVDIPDDWRVTAIGLDNHAYRIKPHIPKTATETFYGHSTKSVQLEWGFSRVTNGFSDTHCITFTTIDGVPDCASVKMEVL